jgi:hypothetical protein
MEKSANGSIETGLMFHPKGTGIRTALLSWDFVLPTRSGICFPKRLLTFKN